MKNERFHTTVYATLGKDISYRKSQVSSEEYSHFTLHRN